MFGIDRLGMRRWLRRVRWFLRWAPEFRLFIWRHRWARAMYRLQVIWRELAATFGDWRECGDLCGHARAFLGVLLGAIGEDSAEWRP